ncbi:MAG: TolC family protein, partial [Acidobacteriota bacterium]
MKSSFVALRSASLLSAAPCLVAALLGVAEATPRFEQVEQVERSPTSIAACEIAVEADAGSETGQIDVSESFHVFDAQLEKLITALLTGNPRLQSARARCASSRERVAQHRSLPDPQLQYRYFASPPETRVGPQRHGLEISQAFPWAGKRSLQAERSSHQAESLAWEVRALERSLVAELKRVYFDAAYLQEALRVNHAEKELLRRFEQIALTRYKTGQGIQQNVVKVQTDINRLIDREAFLREQLLVIERQIARLIGSSGGPISLDPIRLAPPPALEDTSQLASRSLSKHPSARSRETRIAA